MTQPPRRSLAALYGFPELIEQLDLDFRETACRSLDRAPWLPRMVRRVRGLTAPPPRLVRIPVLPAARPPQGRQGGGKR